MKDYEGPQVGPDREKLPIPETLDPETLTWLLERLAFKASEMGLEEIKDPSMGSSQPEDLANLDLLTKNPPTSPEGKAGALYMLGWMIETARNAYTKTHAD